MYQHNPRLAFGEAGILSFRPTRLNDLPLVCQYMQGAAAGAEEGRLAKGKESVSAPKAEAR